MSITRKLLRFLMVASLSTSLCISAVAQDGGSTPDPYTVKAQDGSVEKDGEVTEDDYNEVEETTAKDVDEVGEQFKVASVTFEPPSGWEFKEFEGYDTHVDIWTEPDALNPYADPDTYSQIKVFATFDNLAQHAGQFPIKCEGNLKPPEGEGDGGDAEFHWAAKIKTSKLEFFFSTDGNSGDLDQSDDTYMPVQADAMGYDLEGNGIHGFNVVAVLRGAEDEEEYGELKVKWAVTGAGFVSSPKFRVISNPEDTMRQGEREVRLKDNKISMALIDIRAPLPANPAELRAKAGDKFTVKVEIEIDEETKFEGELKFVVTPGDRAYHVTNPPAGFSAAAQFSRSHAQFMNDFREPNPARFQVPLQSEATEDLSIYFFDKFHNPLEEGSPVALDIRGSGRIEAQGYNPKNESQPNPEGLLKFELGANGGLQLVYKQDRYPHCPWQPDESNQHFAVIWGRVQGQMLRLDRSKVDTNVDNPTYPRLSMDVSPNLTASPDIDKKDTRVFTAVLTRGGRPVEDAQVKFTSTNGKLIPADGVAVTDAQGRCSVTLTSTGARVGNIHLLATAGGLSYDAAKISMGAEDYMEWVDTSELALIAEHPVIVGDAEADGWYEVDVLDDTGEGLPFQNWNNTPGFAEGDGKLKVPYFYRTKIKIKGKSVHKYLVGTGNDWEPQLYYTFEALNGQITTDEIQELDATVNGATLETTNPFKGYASLDLSRGDTMVIPENPAIELEEGTQISLQVKMGAIPAAGTEIVSRLGQYGIAVLPNGHVEFAVWVSKKNFETVVTNQPIPINAWTNITARVFDKGISVTINSDTVSDGQYNLFNQKPTKGSGALTIGGQVFQGQLDEFVISKYVPKNRRDQSVLIEGLDNDGTVTTDSNGEAEFYVSWNKEWVASTYIPEMVDIEVFGSEREVVRVAVTRRSFLAHLTAAGKSFLKGTEGLGDDAAWYETAAAWVSEVIPFAADLRQIGFEIYKGASGCDDVSVLNITASLIGLTLDVVTFGIAGGAAKAAVKGVSLLSRIGRTALKTAADAGVAYLVSRSLENWISYGAMLATELRDLPPDHWLRNINTETFLTTFEGWMLDNEVKDLLQNGFDSVDDYFATSKMIVDLGAGGAAIVRDFILETEEE